MKPCYSIRNIIHEGGIIRAEVFFDPGHAVFRSHFPGRPLVPGALTVRIAEVILEEVMKKSAVLIKARSIKFLAPVIPVADQPLSYTIQIPSTPGEECAVQVEYQGNVCAKIIGVFGE